MTQFVCLKIIVHQNSDLCCFLDEVILKNVLQVKKDKGQIISDYAQFH